MADEYTFARWVPADIQEWARNIGTVPDTEGVSGRPILAEILSAATTQIHRNGRAFIQQFSKVADWQNKLQAFFLELSCLERPIAASDLTPSEADTRMTDAVDMARKLASIINANPTLFLRDTTRTILPAPPDFTQPDYEVSDILTAFAHATESDRRIRQNDGGGPSLGRLDGDKAAQNKLCRHISILAEHYLGGRYLTFCAAIAGVICNIQDGIATSTYEEHAVK